MAEIKLGNINIEVEQKAIKNIHLSVYPPNGTVRIAAPEHLDLDTIRVFALSKLTWIKKEQKAFQNQERELPRKFVTRENHYFLGERYLLKVIEQDEKPKVILKINEIELYIRPNTPTEKRRIIMDEWHRSELKKRVPDLIKKWENRIGVSCNEYGIKKMKTKWGTCNTEAKRIWINLELARKPLICLEYIIAHELIHLIERSHNQRFVSLMDEFMPLWRTHRQLLNTLPFSHVDWKY